MYVYVCISKIHIFRYIQNTCIYVQYVHIRTYVQDTYHVQMCIIVSIFGKYFTYFLNTCKIRTTWFTDARARAPTPLAHFAPVRFGDVVRMRSCAPAPGEVASMQGGGGGSNRGRRLGCGGSAPRGIRRQYWYSRLRSILQRAQHISTRRRRGDNQANHHLARP